MSDDSLAETIRSEISKKFDENPEYFSDKKNRINLKKELTEKYPEKNSSTIGSLVSRELPKIAKSYNVSEDKIKDSPKQKFAKSLSIKTREKKSDISPPQVKNPIVNPDVTSQNENIQHPYTITDGQISAFCDSLYHLAQAGYSDLDDLSDDEKKDLGYLWTPLAQSRISGERGLAVLAVGGTAGILGRKIKNAKTKKKKREEQKPKTIEPPKEEDPKETFRNG